jgi:MFS family permease
MTATPFPREAKRYENLLVVVLFLAFGFVFFDRQAVPFLFPFISEELGLTNTQLGVITGVLAVTWALSGAAVGKLSDKLGVRKPILIAAILAFSTFSACCSSEPSWVSPKVRSCRWPNR